MLCTGDVHGIAAPLIYLKGNPDLVEGGNAGITSRIEANSNPPTTTTRQEKSSLSFGQSSCRDELRGQLPE
ncbi:hypothetical protein MINTM015_22490 [Mycobacterium paraintracellulare]|nr:hypothetical protein MINTM015_22490 [Mycobacterium paraintracellulare]